MLQEIYRRNKEWGLKLKSPLVEVSKILKMCKECYAFGYGGGWHFDSPKNLPEGDAEGSIPVELCLCPACIEEAVAVLARENAKVPRLFNRVKFSS